ncbi:isochorismate pyruvate lyase [Sphingomonas laterariae]|uniref:chorismate mutase n=1 Tax=Edaphosphingomonas laterariae TaxID=861865 RepID=A0A239BMR4_9SPHN|nr:chorismate mutase [Sphingomonas laterariae]SNS09477.1 isochorismate pyruvate lyase [Sphingomonas laterariae]
MPEILSPEDCSTMAEVRAGVDALDERIVTMLGTRMRYMDAAARIKATRDAVRDEARKAQVIDNAAAVAERVGVPTALIRELYDRLVEGSIAYEFDKFDAR